MRALAFPLWSVLPSHVDLIGWWCGGTAGPQTTAIPGARPEPLPVFGPNPLVGVAADDAGWVGACG